MDTYAILRTIIALAAVLSAGTAFSILYAVTAKGTGKAWNIPAHAFNMTGCLAFTVHFITDGIINHQAQKILSWYGYVWMFTICNGIMILAALALMHRVLKKTNAAYACRLRGKPAVLAFLTVLSAICISGYRNYSSIRTFRICLTVNGETVSMTGSGYINRGDRKDGRNRTNQGQGTLRIAFASDIHLGEGIGPGRLETMMEHVRSLEPDIVIFGGDLLDRGEEIPVADNCSSIIAGLDVPSGKYAVFGNHEYYADDISRIISFYRDAGITILRDSSVTVGDRLFLSGKDDSSCPLHDTDFPERENAGDMEGMLRLGISHRPENMEKFAENGYDLVLCGHTHNGQFFPGNILVRFDRKHNSGGYIYGLYDIGEHGPAGSPCRSKTKVYVSCGLGLWGPHFRTFSQSETVLVEVTFED